MTLQSRLAAIGVPIRERPVWDDTRNNEYAAFGTFEYIEELHAALESCCAKIEAMGNKSTLCGGCLCTYLSPMQDDEHGFGRCVDQDGERFPA